MTAVIFLLGFLALAAATFAGFQFGRATRSEAEHAAYLEGVTYGRAHRSLSDRVPSPN